MTRGNQREIDRARAAARAAKGRKEGNEGDPKLRAERDAKALQEKIAKKQAAKAAAGDGGQEQKGKNKKADKNAYTVFIK
ncbi:hypothetical protein NGA_0403900 [Nannochloropsis gaditana CCMP526]|uniref:uncharacterized protein n=1 Tax=Nannochloropsis gaditana (strain CCMP526) TaxID=1093141 RepID=UPI00029F5A22|nr:hypothetical protein NGA_0403900 [Nannochloropsis gaditana CCMP526]EKU21623.1 hypothetical protein NGA_0403900 [Nannochloropsis gaditana CCMP526]|eukprot:XP_005854734.1 hypothetical protein NGA_0403900 [Nannochloropsis gaditana CCMP526]